MPWAMLLTPLFLSTLPARGATQLIETSILAEAEFLSTLPARGATWPALSRSPAVKLISIHAPREGSDGPFAL